MPIKPVKSVFAAVFAFTVFTTLAAALDGGAAWASVRREGNLWVVDDATGVAPVKGGNKAAAREEAKREAYRDAIEKAIGAFVQGVTEMQNYEVVKDKVFSKSQGLVKSFDLVSEKVDSDQMMTVIGVCRVVEAALDGVLGPAVIDAIGNPRVMAIIDERYEERYGDGVNAAREVKEPFISTTEGAVLAVFEKAGYQIIDPEQVHAIMNIDPSAVWDDPKRASDAAKTLNADIVVAGKAYASAHTPSRIRVSGVPLWGVRSTVQLKAVLTKTAYQIGSQVVEKMSKGQTVEDGAIRGFKEAAPPAALSIVNKIAYAMTGAGPGLQGITVKAKIGGVSYAKSEALLGALREFAGKGGGVYDRGFTDGLLEVDVVSPKNVRAVAAFLSEEGVKIDSIDGQIIYAQAAGSEEGEGKGDARPAAVKVSITGVPSFDEAGALEDAMTEFLSGGEVESEFAEGTMTLTVSSGKKAREIASFLSKRGVKVSGVSSSSVSGEWGE